jgi:hypothetical protein
VYALQSLSAMAPHLRKRTLLAVVSKLLPLLQHPAVAVRAAVVGAVAAAARVLPAVDVYTRLSPMVSGVLGVVPLTLTGWWLVARGQGLHKTAVFSKHNHDVRKDIIPMVAGICIPGLTNSV